MNIESHIISLLYRYDCVIVPGFGGFIVNPGKTEIRGDIDQFIPAARKISFNQNITRNDGLLADAIAGKESLRYEAAVKLIDDFNKKNSAVLNEGGKVGLKGIGTFYQDSQGLLQFEPDADANFLTASFGLSAFRSPAIRRDGIEKVLEKKVLRAQPMDAPHHTALRKMKTGSSQVLRYWPAAAALLLLFTAGYIFLRTDLLNRVSVNYSNLNPFDHHAEGTYKPRAAETGLEKEELLLPKDDLDRWLEGIPEPVVAESNRVAKKEVAKRFHVIGGCFEIVANANKLMRKLKSKGFDPQLVGKNRRGLQRVAFGSYETRAEARKALKDIRQHHMKSAWLFVSAK